MATPQPQVRASSAFQTGDRAACASATSPDDQQILLRRLWRSDELIRQLKQIIKAQCLKIEQLGERPSCEGVLNLHLASQASAQDDDVRQECEDYRHALNRLQAENGKLRSDNETLRKVNRRLRSMLEQQGMPRSMELSLEPVASGDFPAERPDSSAQGIDLGAAGESLRMLPCLQFRDPRAEVLPRSKLTTAQSHCRPGNCQSRPGSRAAASGAKIVRLANCLPMLWEKLDCPLAALHALSDLAERLVSDVPHAVVTVYVLDSWLKAVAAAADLKEHGPPVSFSLGKHEGALQVLRRPGGNQKFLPPRFKDLKALPLSSRKVLATAVPSTSAPGLVAVVQCSIPEEFMTNQSLQLASLVPSHFAAVDDELHAACPPRTLRNSTKDHSNGLPVGFSETALPFLTLVCNIIASFLGFARLQEHRGVALLQTKECLHIAVELNQAKTILDLESRLKHLFGNFFNVSVVRLLFYDDKSKRLVLSAIHSKRKECTFFDVYKGIVGTCARKKELVHIPDLAKHEQADVIADGLLKGGAPIGARAACLCGPMMVPAEDLICLTGETAGSFSPGEQRLLGVVQLIERVKPQKVTSAGVFMPGAFSPEDREYFKQLLEVCSSAALKVMQVQQLELAGAGLAGGIVRLLSSLQ